MNRRVGRGIDTSSMREIMKGLVAGIAFSRMLFARSRALQRAEP